MPVSLNYRTVLFDVACAAIEQGPGYAQAGHVLREAAKQLNVSDLSDQQALLTAWQDLFAKGDLAWGYDLGNTTHPFYHRPA